MNKKIKCFLFVVLLMVGVVLYPFSVNADEDDELVIVIDPGHGGSQNGAEYNGLKEKDINMVVSEVLVEELEKYDNVKIYLTHDSAEDEMSIKERADFADEVDADYFFCIHFNASGNHNFYGSEAWITSYGRYYSEMYAFSQIVLDEFSSIGVFNRGIKTKLETDGTDYYGVLRRCAEYDIPAVIIEHCHMDNAMDTSFLDQEDLIKFGQLDAQAIAKFLKLKSSEIGVDYSNYESKLPEEPVEKIQNDITDPICSISVKEINDSEQKITFTMQAQDEEYPILYYAYSSDGGRSFSDLYTWERNSETMEVVLSYAEGIDKQFVVKVYNAYNLYGDSNVIVVSDEIQKYREANAMDEEETKTVSQFVVQPQTGGELYLVIAILSILCAVISLVVLIVNLGRDNGK